MEDIAFRALLTKGMLAVKEQDILTETMTRRFRLNMGSGGELEVLVSWEETWPSNDSYDSRAFSGS